MLVKYKVVGWDSTTGNLTVEVRAASNPMGWRLSISALKDDGTYYTRDELLERIEAALPVAEFEKLAAQQALNPDDTHIRELALEPEREVDRSPMDQGVLKPVVLG